MRPFLTPWGLQEEKCVYWKVSVGLKCVRMSRIPWLWNLLSQYWLQDWNKFLYFSGRLKSSAFAQSKQICSFDDGDTHTRSIDLVGVESAHTAIEVIAFSRRSDDGERAKTVSPRFFPLVFLFVLAAYDLICSPLSKGLEQAIQVKDSQMKLETSKASHATLHFWCEMHMATNQARRVDLSRLRRSRSATSRPNKSRSARQEVDL